MQTHYSKKTLLGQILIRRFAAVVALLSRSPVLLVLVSLSLLISTPLASAQMTSLSSPQVQAESKTSDTAAAGASKTQSNPEGTALGTTGEGNIPAVQSGGNSTSASTSEDEDDEESDTDTQPNQNKKAGPKSWSEIVATAKANNPELKSTRSDLKASINAKRAVFGGYLPTFSLFGERSRTEQEFTEPISKTTQNTTDKATKYGWKSTLSLFDGFATTGKFERADAQTEIARMQIRQKQIDIRYQLRAAYFQLMIGQKQKELAERILERQKTNRNFIKLKYESGAEAFWSVQQSEADLESAKMKLQVENSGLNDARAELARILDSGDDMEIDLTHLDAKDESAKLLKPLTSNTFEADQHPNVRILTLQVRDSDGAVKVARSEFLPSLDASYTWVRSKLDDKDPGIDNTVALTLTWPIFSGLSSFHGVQQARATRYSKETQLIATRESIRTQMNKSRRGYANSLSQIPVSDLQLKAAQARATTITAQYRLGLKKYLDWENAQTKLIDAERETIRVRRDALLALADFERIAGLGLEDE